MIKIMNTISLFFLILLLAGCGQKEEIVAKINEEEITKPEFMLYLYEAQKSFESIGGSDIWETDFEGQTAEEVAKERALNAMQTVIISAQKAPLYHVELTQEEKQTAKEEGEYQLSSMSQKEKEEIGISPEEMTSVMERKMLYGKVYQEVIKNFQLSEADFESFFEQNKEQYKDMYTKFQVQSILIEDETTARQIAARAKQGEDFQSLFMEYESDEEEKKKQDNTMEVYKGSLESMFNVKFDLEPGAITDPLPMPEGYYILKIVQKTQPTQEQMQDMARQYSTAYRQQQLFDDEYNKWFEQSKIEKNETVWNEIRKIDS